MSDRYDRAITVFSPDGHLFQVEDAQEAVKKGSTAVGVRGKNIVVLGVEKKAVAKLQEDITVRKIALLDDHVALAFAGLTADARILINRRYTQSNGRSPFGLSALIISFDNDGTPRLYQTDPSEFLEKHYTEEVQANDDECIKLTLKALLEVVQSGGKNMEVAEKIEEYITEIEKEREEEAEQK
ncbi:unnamed protein product [Candidula unifasciata]|uniref:Proteasome alpha-type subunits domain-containing protein n=1 Tax=Candidula unifasciata TaxID=100452 RepID=A0A8S4A4V6_9EUPU|nr:unnamed protein product [Candidula unifasciata]